MNTTVETMPQLVQRVAALEKQLADLRDEVLGHAPIKKDWEASIGIYPDDEMSRSAFRLADEWRQSRDAS